jgi:hypothetical protein
VVLGAAYILLVGAQHLQRDRSDLLSTLAGDGAVTICCSNVSSSELDFEHFLTFPLPNLQKFQPYKSWGEIFCSFHTRNRNRRYTKIFTPSQSWSHIKMTQLCNTAEKYTIFNGVIFLNLYHHVWEGPVLQYAPIEPQNNSGTYQCSVAIKISGVFFKTNWIIRCCLF